jgi:(p)ppGpp synthase/HD superfamily hydrolase
VPLGPRFEEALIYATRLHALQTRKASDIPYIAHLLGVASLVLEDGGGEDEAIAALLHDAIEDQGGAATREEIRRRFGDRITAWVDACTDSETIPKPPWRERKERLLSQARVAAPEVRRILAADKLHNVRSVINDYRRLGGAIWSRFTEGKPGTLWFYHAMGDVLAAGPRSQLVEQLRREVVELEQLVAGEDK